MILHLVRPRELLLTHRTREDLALLALVIEERMPLEAVLVFERLLHVHLCALRAMVDAVTNGRVAKEIEATYAHLRKLFGRVLALRRRPAACTSLHRLSA